ncbi:hypothetical protein N7465_011167 [Penicillium sp. CMV-2018d]|nr:hypothetical protein N7465_011167 [Penicillium sp. CMV-2018d]
MLFKGTDLALQKLSMVVIAPLDLTCSGDENHPMIYGHLRPDSQYPLGFESDGMELVCTTSLHSHAVDIGNSTMTNDCFDMTIDLAILEDNHLRDVEQATDFTSRLETFPNSLSSQPSRSMDKDFRDSQRETKKTPNLGQQSSRISKGSVVVENHTKGGAG